MYGDLCDLLIAKYDENEIVSILKDKYENSALDRRAAKKGLTYIKLKFRTRWNNSKRTRSRFYSNNSAWLKNVFQINAIEQSNPGKGRPMKKFSQCGKKTQKAKCASLINNFSMGELVFAASSSIASAGSRSKAKAICSIVDDSSKVQKSTTTKQNTPYTPSEALAFLCKNDFTKAQYCNVRSSTLQTGVDIYPPYNKIVEAKALCYPTGFDFVS